MPIVGLTTNRQATFPRIGKIRKGDEKVDDRRPGADLNYFRIVADNSALQAQINQLFGVTPRELKVVLPFSTIEECFDPWMKEYGKTGLKRQCDGNQQVLWLPEDSPTYRGVHAGDAPLPCLQAQKGCKCQRNAALKVVIPEIFALGRTGYFELSTSSKHDILHIQGLLEYVFQLRQTLLGVRFIIRREAEEKSYPKADGKRSLKTYNLVKLEVDPEWMQVQLHNQYAQQMGLPTIEPSRPQITYASVQAQLQPAIEPEPVAIDVEILPDTSTEWETKPEKAAAPVTKPAPKTSATVEVSGTNLIDDNQRKRLFTIATTAGYTKEGVKTLLAAGGIESSADIPRAKYDKICELLADPELATAWNDRAIGQWESTMPVGDRIRAQIKAAEGDVKALQTIKVSISMQAEQLSPAIAGALTDQVDKALKQLEVTV